MSRQPPALATRLLERLGPDNAALSGDLREAYEGKSASWYWRQVLAAICVGAMRDGRLHVFGVARGVAIGWGVMWMLAVHVAPIIVGFDSWLFVRGVRWFYLHGFHMPSIHGLPWIVLSCAVCAGGVVSVKASRVRGPAAAFAYTLAILCTNVVFFLRWFVELSNTPAVTYGVPPYSTVEVLSVAVLMLPMAALVGGLATSTPRRIR